MTLQRAVGFCLILLSTSCFATTRHYYIAAEDVTWDYAPSGHDLLTGEPLPQPWLLKREWPKTRFIEYTDGTFTTKKPQPEWLGILGPVIRAEVGDDVVVEFLNRSHLPSQYAPARLALRQEQRRYSLYSFWQRRSGSLPEENTRITGSPLAASGPGPGQPSSIVWWYHAHVEPASRSMPGFSDPSSSPPKAKRIPTALRRTWIANLSPRS